MFCSNSAHKALLFLLLTSWATTACSNDGVEVSIRVVTSLVAGPEFATVQTLLVEPGTPAERVLETYDFPAAVAQPFARGVLVAKLDDVSEGPLQVRVRLLRPNGTLLVQRLLNAEVTGDSTLTVHLTRDCVDVMCPSAGGSAAFTECLAGRCVDPRCTPSTSEFCPDITFCGHASECPAVASCASILCTDGLCQSESVPDACSSDQWCHPDDGCRGGDMIFDAGVDAEPADAASIDVGMDADLADAAPIGADVNAELSDAAPQDGGADEDASEHDATVAVVDMALSDMTRAAADSSRVDRDGDHWFEDEDCDDGDESIRPDAFELCNGVDDDCDGDTDEDLLAPAASLHSGVCASSVKVCAGASGWVQPDYTFIDGYEAVEVSCDSIDNDCDGQTDEGLSGPLFNDHDGDGYGTSSAGNGCVDESHALVSGDCDDDNGEVHPNAAEVCDGYDNDCANGTDDGVLVTVYADNDGDGYGTGSPFTGCPQEGTSLNNLDCDDGASSRRPGVAETCDNIDNDCDYLVDGPSVGSCADGSFCIEGGCAPCTTVSSPVTGQITSDAVWCASSSPIRINGEARINAGVTVVIREGVRIEFDDADLGPFPGSVLTVLGTLRVEGTEANPVVFTSRLASPGESSWGEIGVAPGLGGSLQLNHAVIEYAQTGISMYSGSGASLPLSVRNSVIHDCAIGMYSNYLNGLRLAESTIRDNAYAAIGGSGWNVSNTTFMSNAHVFESASGSFSDVVIQSNDDVAATTSAVLARALIVQNGGASLGRVRCTSCTIADNNGAIEVASSGQIASSNICGNGTVYDVTTTFSSSSTFALSNNYWCSTSEVDIGERIYEHGDSASLAHITFTPIATSVISAAPPWDGVD